MTRREYTLDELSRPRWRQIFDRAVEGGAPRFVLGALAVVTTLSVASTAIGAKKSHSLRRELLSRQAAEVAKTPAEDRAMLERVDQIVVKMAHEGEASTWLSPRLKQKGAVRALLGGEGVYFRAVTTEVPGVEAVHVAAGKSVRDAVPMCLLRDEGEGQAEEAGALRERVSKACEPGTGCVGYSMARVHNYRQVVPGLRVLSDGWARQAEDAGHVLLGLMATDLHDRLEADVPRARAIAAKSGYLLVVLDDAPRDLPEQFWGSRRDPVLSSDHQVRVGLFDARTGEPLARLSLPVSADVPLVAGAHDEVRRQMLSCQLGLDIRSSLEGG